MNCSLCGAVCVEQFVWSICCFIVYAELQRTGSGRPELIKWSLLHTTRQSALYNVAMLSVHKSVKLRLTSKHSSKLCINVLYPMHHIVAGIFSCITLNPSVLFLTLHTVPCCNIVSLL